MTAVIEVENLTKRYRSTTAVDDVSFRLEENTIYGFLGGNGAGKTTTMSLLTAQNAPTSGSIRVFGERPYENHRVLSRMCFVRESQRYPEDFTPRHSFDAARMFFPRWDEDFAQRLIDDFHVPVHTAIKKLSRGQLSAVGVIIGLAARAEITFFDEPYLGLDAVARSLFYERLLEDYTHSPRTIVLSSHLIDEISDLVERVLLIDDGRLLIDESTDDLRGRAVTLTGNADQVDRFAEGRTLLHRQAMGSVASATVYGALTDAEQAEATAVGLERSSVPLQQLVVHLTKKTRSGHSHSHALAHPTPSSEVHS
ncbi:ABC transporter ATP-binding protein [Brevibacterium yomogidense]|uniref:ABC transporter ATP-binding protein n=1 Tax=Brevibacterium yomogidense TaxID=946573 RepID=UPI0018DF148A|nr:ABC transporter ATP-binding protein [Brevibacterium yomogidense]